MVNNQLLLHIHAYLDSLKKSISDVSAQESLEVAVEALEDAFIASMTSDDRSKMIQGYTLDDIYNAGVSALPTAPKDTEASSTDKTEADRLKMLGNDSIRGGRLDEAIDFYSQAIKIDNTNAIYYCNRAAAYVQKRALAEAKADAERAVELDPRYSKGHSRLGAVAFELGNFETAVSAYGRALALEPENEAFKKNLDIAKVRLANKREQEARTAPPAEGLGGLGNLLNNPAIQGMMSNIMGGGQSAAASPAAAEDTTPSAPSEGAAAGSPNVDGVIDSLFEAFPAFRSLQDDPAFIRLRQSGKLNEIAQAVQEGGPMAALRFMSDPDVQPIISRVMGSLGGAGGLGGMLGGLFGGAGAPASSNNSTGYHI
ncbi:TPR repeat [Carpediemonas membranifera]|uniref:TPR repeat n=1 Tax=Carpediemonas membranifera TaxID=201153 RepID=A0A8J6B2J0_9EUKA|nr:TPR repeat [Carpediemonas membranifera]|eukprot:KAG9391529.1 TPR repeat [Carpediemonas membranifera]